MRTILGLDPGSRFTGYGVIRQQGEHLEAVDYGVLSVSARQEFAAKLVYLETQLEQIFTLHQPHDTVVEKIFAGKNADSAFKLGHVRGLCLLHAAKSNSHLMEYAARSVKKMVTGHGGATKEHVRAVVFQCLRLNADVRMDATDALALAVAQARDSARRQAMGELNL